MEQITFEAVESLLWVVFKVGETPARSSVDTADPSLELLKKKCCEHRETLIP